MGSNPPIRAVPFQQAQPSVHIARFLKRTLPYAHEHRRRGLDYFRRSRQGGDVLLPEDWDLNVAYGNEDLAAAAAAVAKAVSSSHGGGSGSFASASSSTISPTTPAGLGNMSPMSLAAFASLAAQREGRGQRVPNLVVRGGGAVKTIDGERGKHGLRNARRNLDPYPHIPHQRVVAHGDLMSHGPAATPVTASPDRSFLQNIGNLGLPTTSTPARPSPATPSSSMPMFPVPTLSLQEQLMAMFGVNNFHELQAAARAHHATRQRMLALQQQKATSPSAPVVAEPAKAASPPTDQRDGSGGGARVKSDSVQAGAGRLTLAPAAGIFARGVASQPLKVAQGDAEPLRNPAATVAFDENRFLGIGRLPSPHPPAGDRPTATAAPVSAAPPPFPFPTQQATPQTQRMTTASTAQQQRTLPTFDIARHADPLAAVPDAFLSQPVGPNWSHLFQQLDATQQPQSAPPQLQGQVSPVGAGAHLRAPNFGQRSPTPHGMPSSAAATVQWSNWANNASSTMTAGQQQQADPSSAGGGAHSPADQFSPSRLSQNRLQGWSPIPAAYAVPGATNGNGNGGGNGNTNGNAASPNGTLRAVSADEQRWEQQFGTDWYRPVSAPPQPSFVISNELGGDMWADMANAAANATPVQSPTGRPGTQDRAQPAQQHQQQQQDSSSIPAADWILAAPSPCNVDGTRPNDPAYDSTATGSFLPTPESTNYQPYSPFGVDTGASVGRHAAPAPYSYGQPADKAGLDLAGKLPAPARSPNPSACSPFDLGASPFGALDANSPPAFGLDAFGFDSLLDPTFASLEPQHQAQHQTKTQHAFAQRVNSPRAPF